MTHVARINSGEPSSRAMEPGTRKMPTPIVVPMTMQVESSNPSCRRSSERVVAEGRGELNWLFIDRTAQKCQCQGLTWKPRWTYGMGGSPK